MTPGGLGDRKPHVGGERGGRKERAKRVVPVLLAEVEEVEVEDGEPILRRGEGESRIEPLKKVFQGMLVGSKSGWLDGRCNELREAGKGSDLKGDAFSKCLENVLRGRVGTRR